MPSQPNNGFLSAHNRYAVMKRATAELNKQKLSFCSVFYRRREINKEGGLRHKMNLISLPGLPEEFTKLPHYRHHHIISTKYVNSKIIKKLFGVVIEGRSHLTS